jgi:sugar lactone lactonase YvrE
MMRNIFLLIAVCTAIVSAQSPNNAYNLSRQRLAMKDTAGYFYLAEQAYQLAPFNLEFTVNYARACVVVGRQIRALNLLQTIADMGFDFGLDSDSSFMPLWKQSKFKQLVQKAKSGTTKIASNYVFSLQESDLIPEGITYDPRQQKFFVSSIYKRKVLAVNTDGTASDFVGEAQYGLFSTVGLKVDAARNHLWVLGIINKPKPRTFTKEELGTSAVYQFDLETKTLINKYTMSDTLQHLFNDLVIVNGSVYFTDSRQRCVYKVNPATKTIDSFYGNPWLYFPNGITASADQQYLFIASWAGILRLSLADTTALILQSKVVTTLSGIDGLYFYENSLIAVQNSAGPQSRIMKFELSKKMDEVTNATVLESQNPLYNIPTTGTIIDDELYFIANSQLQNFDEQGNIFPSDKMQPTYILKVKLNPKE